MEQTRKMNLPIVGRVQHGEQQIVGKVKKVVDYGYFIAKIRDDNMNFLLNRFNEKYPQKKMIHIQFFDEEPLSIRKIRYNQSGAVCYCMQNQKQGKQKANNIWKPIQCGDDCKYKISADGKAKPMCNLEGTLKFLLPEVSSDRVWIMKITGYTSIQRLNEYFNLQKQLGNSLIGDFYIFLKKENQTTVLGKSFNNYILDIIRKENFISNNNISPISMVNSTNNSKNVDNSKIDKPKIEDEKTVMKSENTKLKEKNVITEKKLSQKEDNTTKQNENSNIENGKNSNEFDNYYILVDMESKVLMKDGKPSEYLIATFVDQNDKNTDVVISPKFVDELSKCDVGTTVKLNLATAGDRKFTENIEYVQKCLKNVAA